MRINEEDNRIILDGMEGPIADYAYLCGLADAYLVHAKRMEKKLKEMIALKEKEDGKEK